MLCVGGEGWPVGFIIIGISAFGRGDIEAVKSVFDEQGKVVRREFQECPPGTPRGEVGRDEGDIWGGGLCVDVIGSACGGVCVNEDGEIGKLSGESLTPRICGL